MKYEIIYDNCTERTGALWTPFFFIERLSHCISKRFPAPSLLNQCFFMSESSLENQEQMQYHLKSSCSSGEVKVQIQACTQWPGGKRLSAQVKVHY